MTPNPTAGSAKRTTSASGGRAAPQELRPCSRRAIQIVDARMTKAPSKVVWLGTSENTSQPITDAQIKSRKRKDWVAEMSADDNG